jgi:hypothetical protein
MVRGRALEAIRLALAPTDARIKRLHAAEAERWLRLADLKPRTEVQDGLDGFEHVEQVARGARQAVEAGDDEHVAGLQPVDHLPQLGAVAPRA